MSNKPKKNFFSNSIKTRHIWPHVCLIYSQCFHSQKKTKKSSKKNIKRKLPRTKSMLLDRKGRRHSIDLTNIKQSLANNSSLIESCSISSRTRPLIDLMQANATSFSLTTKQLQCSSPNSVKGFIAMQQRQTKPMSAAATATNTTLMARTNSSHNAQTDLSNAFAQLLLRRKTFSAIKVHQSITGFGQLSERSQSVFLQTQDSKNTDKKQQQVVPNVVPVSMLKAKFEAGLSGLKPVSFSSPKLEKRSKSELKEENEEECEEEEKDSNNETLKTSIRYDRDLIDLDMTLNESFLVRSGELDDSEENFLFNIELEEKSASVDTPGSTKDSKKNKYRRFCGLIFLSIRILRILKFHQKIKINNRIYLHKNIKIMFKILH